MTILASQTKSLLRQGRHEDAELLLVSKLDSEPDRLEAAELLAAIWTNAGRWEDAQMTLEQLISQMTQPCAKLHYLLADCCRSQGLLDEAYKEYAIALDLDPLCGGAALALADAGDSEEKEKLAVNLERTLQGQTGAASHISELHFAVAKINDKLGDFSKAFHHYKLANALTGRDIQYSFNADYISATRQAFSKKLFKSLKGAGYKSQSPVFIVGMPRSGTTLLEQQLSRHPAIQGMGELIFVDAIAQSIAPSNKSKQPYPQSVGLMSEDQATEFGRRYVQNTSAQVECDSVKRTIDKAPLNFQHLGLIRTILPQAHIIHIQRDPLDTCLSCYFQAFSGRELSFSNSLEDCAEYYIHYRNIMKLWARNLPGRILHVNYRSLVEEPEATLRQILQFSGLAWSEQCLESNLQETKIRTASVTQARQPIYRSSINRWKNYEPFIEPLQTRLAAYL